MTQIDTIKEISEIAFNAIKDVDEDYFGVPADEGLIKNEAYMVAVALVEKNYCKREFVSPAERVDCYPSGQFECPGCGCGLTVNDNWRMKFCPECGAALDWERKSK